MPAFSAGDLFDGMAEEIFVIEINLRDHGDLRHDYIGRVEAAAHAHFEHGNIRALLGEIGERDGGNAFEKGRMGRQRAAARAVPR